MKKEAQADPIESSDTLVLSTEILRLRDITFGLETTAEVQTDQIAELKAENARIQAEKARIQSEHQAEVRQQQTTISHLEGNVESLNASVAALTTELGRSRLIRLARMVGRKLGLVKE